MSSQYVFFVTGLPDVALDAGKPSQISLDFISEIEDRLDREDRSLFETIRRPIDNVNLIRILENRNEEFDPRGTFTKEDIDLLVKGTVSGPDYMDAFLKARRESRNLFPGLNSEDTLAWLFQEEIDMHPNAFIREWGEFESDIRNVLAVLNARKTNIDPSSVVVGKKGVAETVLKSSSQDLSLTQSHPWVEKLVNAQNLMQRDKIADQIRWDWLNDMRIFSHFQIEALLSYLLQLFIMERWLKLDPVEGKKLLNKLSVDLSSGLERFLPAS